MKNNILKKTALSGLICASSLASFTANAAGEAVVNAEFGSTLVSATITTDPLIMHGLVPLVDGQTYLGADLGTKILLGDTGTSILNSGNTVTYDTVTNTNVELTGDPNQQITLKSFSGPDVTCPILTMGSGSVEFASGVSSPYLIGSSDVSFADAASKAASVSATSAGVPITLNASGKSYVSVKLKALNVKNVTWDSSNPTGSCTLFSFDIEEQ